ncbi:MAG: conjugal transfer protein TraL, partial [Oscillospiraceae bacterium]|nr:conjugal transfer protein TraL [Oscillospiraceae bacterium]
MALFIRVLLFDYITLDYQDFLSKWVAYFRQNGGFAALKDPVGNYNVPYLYMLSVLSYLPIPDLYGIKLFSVLFDILLSWGGLRLTKRLTEKESAPLICFCVLLLLPSVVLNGACWGQCDSVWAALCLLALATALE